MTEYEERVKQIALFLCCLIMLPLCGSAQAQDSRRIVPETRAQVQFSFAPLVKKIAPAVVNIYTRHTVTQLVSPFAGDPLFRQFFGMDMPGQLRRKVQNSLGTGVIVGAEGTIVTNAHVVRDADEINVVLTDGREFSATKELVDKASDIAVLHIDAKCAALPYATLEPSENMEVGDMVLAIGNPFGVGQTVTSGIISALARSALDINDYNFFIQTDAAINPGNSGGPLVAMDGGVIGINSAIFSKDGGSLGIGFAVPSEMVATVLAAAKAGQTGDKIVRPWLGITTQKVTADLAESLGFDVPHGLLVAYLNKASPLREAGMQVGDVIVSMNGHPISDSAEMKFRMATVPIGDTAKIGVSRKGEAMTINVRAIAPPNIPPRNDTLLAGYNPLAGATVANINPSVSLDLGIGRDGGVVVVKVNPQSQAARLVEKGDIIEEINDRRITDLPSLKEALEGAANGWVIEVDSHGRKRRMVVR
jgi:serine protease Do